jgi:signal transduction histidine kinase
MKSYSLRKKLIIKLSIAISLTLAFILIISSIHTKHEIRKIFDANLAKSSKLILGLIKHEIAEENDPYFIINPQFIGNLEKSHHYEFKLHSQAWSSSKVIYNSDENFIITEPQKTGFYDLKINDKKWRIFVLEDKENQIKVAVLEKYDLRNKLTSEILSTLAFSFLPCFILIIFIIIKTINKGLKPLSDFSLAIEKMSTNTLSKINENNIPNEIKPFTKSFNGLVTKLKSSLESERRFTDYAAHELRTPLSAIKAQAQLLIKNKNKEKQEEFLQDLILGVNRSTQMVEQLLTLTRIESKSDEIVKDYVNLEEILTNLIKEYKTQILQKKIEISYKIDENAKFFINKYHFEILLRNLFENALKYCENDGKIIILAKKDIFYIKNQGNLIKKDEIKFIFKNFFRGKNKNFEAGSGLGLAICKKIVNSRGGKISYKSEADFNVIKVDFS